MAKLTITGTLKSICPVLFPGIFVSGNFLQIIVKASVMEFILSKISCFQHILINTSVMKRLKYENYCLTGIVFQAFKQYSDYKSIIAKTFDGNKLKIKSACLTLVIMNKKHCFHLFLDQTRTLVLHARFLRAGLALRSKFVRACICGNVSNSV